MGLCGWVAVAVAVAVAVYRCVLVYICSLIFVLRLMFMGRGSNNGIDSDAKASLRGTLSFIDNLWI